jgi:predicted transcriptional regulator
MNPLIQQLEARRDALGMPFGILAKRAGVSNRTIYGILRKGNDARIDTIAAIAHALGTRLVFEAELTPHAERQSQAQEQAQRLGIPVSDTSPNRVLWALPPPEPPK